MAAAPPVHGRSGHALSAAVTGRGSQAGRALRPSRPLPAHTYPAAALTRKPTKGDPSMSHSLDEQIVSHHLFSDAPRARALFAQLRREDPVHHTRAPGYPDAWAITK